MMYQLHGRQYPVIAVGGTPTRASSSPTACPDRSLESGQRPVGGAASRRQTVIFCAAAEGGERQRITARGIDQLTLM
jgi:hypothetical protein